jgi:REP element-mobilizing transposase RayT
MPIFFDDADKDFFLSILGRYCSAAAVADRRGYMYKSFVGKLEILCYCLMDNHFHLLLYQSGQGALVELMQAVANTYIKYFNRKYNRRGPLFESRYKASRIETPAYLEHITRYIHLNPKDWRTYRYSSLSAYTGEQSASWLQPERIMDIFDGSNYLQFIQDYECHKVMLDVIKHELADT